MKKLLFVFVLGAFAACGGNTGAEATGDSTSVSLDTTTMSSGSTGTGATGSDASGSAGAAAGGTDTASGAMSTTH